VSVSAQSRAPRPHGIVERGTELRVAGRHEFTLATPDGGQDATEWRLEAEERGARRVIARGVGPAFSVELSSAQRRSTVYHVRARAGRFEDSLRLEVFPVNDPFCYPFVSPGAPEVRAYIYVPPTLSRRTRVAVVMHGKLRNASEYIEGWTAWASRTDHLVLAPRFDGASWPGDRSYNLGNVFSGTDGRGAKRPEESWSFTVVEALHQRVRTGFDLDDPSFALWGHSAGGQFVHRFLLFKPRSPVSAAIAAGCGWFTVPDLGVRFPYGLRHPELRFTGQELRAYLGRPLTIMRGALDRVRDPDLRTTPGAEAQGSNRYERAAHALNVAKRVDPRSTWRLLDVPAVGHDWAVMALAAQSTWE
jgi:poly(3-hydroxybutyrate) depolymerase